MLRKAAAICFFSLTLLNTVAFAAWEGGLWAHDFPEDVSIYGYFRLQLVPTNSTRNPWVLTVEWVETRNGEPDRVAITKQVKELAGFFETPNFEAEVENGGLAMGTLKISHSKGKVIWFQSHELGKYKILYQYKP